MKALKTLLLAIAILVFLGISGAFYTVGEYEQVVITQFGRPVKAVTDAGLHFKIPFIQKLTRYEKRILRWDGDPKEVPPGTSASSGWMPRPGGGSWIPCGSSSPSAPMIRRM